MNIMINLGQDMYISAEEILLVLYANTSPVKKIISDAKADNKLIDLRNRSTLKLRTVIITKQKDVVVCSLASRGLCKRYNDIVNEYNTNSLNVNKIKPMIHIGFHNFIPLDNIYYFAESTSNSSQRTTRIEKKNKFFYNITQSSKTRTKIVLINGELVLTSIYSISLKERIDEAIKCIVTNTPYYAVAKFKDDNSEERNEDDCDISEEVDLYEEFVVEEDE